jgi:hypothetical protein
VDHPVVVASAAPAVGDRVAEEHDGAGRRGRPHVHRRHPVEREVARVLGDGREAVRRGVGGAGARGEVVRGQAEGVRADVGRRHHIEAQRQLLEGHDVEPHWIAIGTLARRKGEARAPAEGELCVGPGQHRGAGVGHADVRGAEDDRGFPHRVLELHAQLVPGDGGPDDHADTAIAQRGIGLAHAVRHRPGGEPLLASPRLGGRWREQHGDEAGDAKPVGAEGPLASARGERGRAAEHSAHDGSPSRLFTSRTRGSGVPRGRPPCTPWPRGARTRRSSPTPPRLQGTRARCRDGSFWSADAPTSRWLLAWIAAEDVGRGAPTAPPLSLWSTHRSSASRAGSMKALIVVFRFRLGLELLLGRSEDVDIHLPTHRQVACPVGMQAIDHSKVRWRRARPRRRHARGLLRGHQ